MLGYLIRREYLKINVHHFGKKKRRVKTKSKYLFQKAVNIKNIGFSKNIKVSS